MFLYLLVSSLPLQAALTPQFTEKVHRRLPGGISLRFYFLRSTDAHNVSVFIFLLPVTQHEVSCQD